MTALLQLKQRAPPGNRKSRKGENNMNNKNLLSIFLGGAILMLTLTNPTLHADHEMTQSDEEPGAPPAEPAPHLAPMGPGRSAEEQAASKSYEHALNFIYDENWSDAVKAFQEHLSKFPKSPTRFASQYWICFANENMETSMEKAFQCYMNFVKTNPQSEWRDQAQTNMVRLGHQLVKSGHPEYEALIKSMKSSDDDEVKMMALRALADTGDTNALPTIIKLYEQSNPSSRVKIIYILRDFDSPVATDKLTQIALSDSDKSIRSKATYALGDKGDAEAVAGLKKILQAQSADTETRKSALYALGNTNDPTVVPVLTEVARSDKDAVIAKAATESLGNIEGKDAQQALQVILKDAKIVEVRKSALYALSNCEGVVAIPSLRDVAINDANVELRKSALYAIADIEGDASMKALVDIFNSSNDPAVQESALYAISDHGGKTAEQLLYNTALNHPNEKLAKTAVYALADQTKDESLMLDILRKSKHPEVQKAALQGILDSGDVNNSVKALTEVLKTEKDNDLRVSTVNMLGDTQSDAAVPILLDTAKNDSSLKVRTSAVNALGSIGTPKAKEALKQILQPDNPQQ